MRQPAMSQSWGLCRVHGPYHLTEGLRQHRGKRRENNCSSTYSHVIKVTSGMLGTVMCSVDCCVIAIGGLTIRHMHTSGRQWQRHMRHMLLYRSWESLCVDPQGRKHVCPGTLLRPIPFRRIGEASHPGPVVRMPGDGHCLYHALGWWAGLSQGQVRQEIANISEGLWNELCPWDNGREHKLFQRQTKDRNEWGEPFKWPPWLRSGV